MTSEHDQSSKQAEDAGLDKKVAEQVSDSEKTSPCEQPVASQESAGEDETPTQLQDKAKPAMISESLMLSGYTNATRKYLLRGTIVCTSLMLICTFIPYMETVPLLFAATCLMGELWWRSRVSWYLLPEGLRYGDELINWQDISHYTQWGPVGIPWTPINLRGIRIYLQNDKCLAVTSVSPTFALLVQRLQIHQMVPTQPTWHQYPPQLIRIARYAIVFAFAIAYMLILAMAWLIFVIGAVVGYFILRSKLKARAKGEKIIPEDTIIPILGCVLLLIVLYFVYQNSTLLFLLGIMPILIVLWFPWQPPPLALMKNAVFVGKNAAYPLRHLRSTRNISKMFIIKIWNLTFANGEVGVLPMLEEFEHFKKKVETAWDDVQKQYYGKELSKDEAQVRTPKEEAKRLRS